MLLEIATALLLAGAWGVPATASEEAGTSENEVRAVIANWYGELARKSDGRVRDLVSFDLIDVSPHSYYPDTGSAALVGPPVYDSLRARALEFRYTISQSRLDEKFGKVRVEDRG